MVTQYRQRDFLKNVGLSFVPQTQDNDDNYCIENQKTVCQDWGRGVASGTHSHFTLTINGKAVDECYSEFAENNSSLSYQNLDRATYKDIEHFWREYLFKDVSPALKEQYVNFMRVNAHGKGASGLWQALFHGFSLGLIQQHKVALANFSSHLDFSIKDACLVITETCKINQLATATAGTINVNTQATCRHVVGNLHSRENGLICARTDLLITHHTKESTQYCDFRQIWTRVKDFFKELLKQNQLRGNPVNTFEKEQLKSEYILHNS